MFCAYLDKKWAYNGVRKEDVLAGALVAAGGPDKADQSLVYLAVTDL